MGSRNADDLVEEFRLLPGGSLVIIDSTGRELFRVRDGDPVLLVEGAEVGGGVTDHGALTGLADDDHAAYATTGELSDHVSDASAAHAATAIAFTPAGTIAATNVQAAIEEAAAEAGAAVLTDPGEVWEAEHEYNDGDLILADGSVWRSDGGGLSGAVEPDWSEAAPGDGNGTVADENFDWLLLGVPGTFSIAETGSPLNAVLTALVRLGIFRLELGSIYVEITDTPGLKIVGLPTADPSVVNELWNNAGVLMVSAG